jgi:hypothetical protein
MTALQYWKAQADEITKEKQKAIASGRKTITYTDHNGKQHNLYYHSGRWNDRPTKIGEYKQ